MNIQKIRIKNQWLAFIGLFIIIAALTIDQPEGSQLSLAVGSKIASVVVGILFLTGSLWNLDSTIFGQHFARVKNFIEKHSALTIKLCYIILGLLSLLSLVRLFLHRSENPSILGRYDLDYFIFVVGLTIVALVMIAINSTFLIKSLPASLHNRLQTLIVQENLLTLTLVNVFIVSGVLFAHMRIIKNTAIEQFLLNIFGLSFNKQLLSILLVIPLFLIVLYAIQQIPSEKEQILSTVGIFRLASILTIAVLVLDLLELIKPHPPTEIFGRYNLMHAAILIAVLISISLFSFISLFLFSEKAQKTLAKLMTLVKSEWLLASLLIFAVGWIIVQIVFDLLYVKSISAELGIWILFSAWLMIKSSESVDISQKKTFNLFFWISRVTDYGLVLVAGWTLATHIIYFMNISFLLSIPLACVFGLLGIFIVNRRELYGTTRVVEENSPPVKSLIPMLLVIWLFALLFNLAVVAWVSIISLGIYILYSEGMLINLSRKTTSIELDDFSTRAETVLFVSLCLISVVLSSTLNRPNPDDVSYYSLSAAVATNPQEPIPSTDPVFPFAEQDYLYPLFPLMSIYYLPSLVSMIFPLQPLTVAGIIIVPIASLFVVFAYARVTRLLFYENWIWVLFAIVALLFIEGSQHHTFANYAFVRIWQGKSILFHVFVPLSIIYGFHYVKQPNFTNWFILLCAQVTAIGLSSIGVWFAPLTLGLSLLANVIYFRKKFTIILTGVTATVYPLVLGLIHLDHIRNRPPVKADFSPESMSNLISGGERTWITTFHFGVGEDQTIMWLGLIIVAILVSYKNRVWRIFMATTVVVIYGIFLNPTLKPLISPITPPYFRVLWIGALPLVGGLILSFPIHLISKIDIKKRILAMLTMIMVYALVVPSVYVFSPQNQTRFNLPGARAYRPDMQVAQVITETLEYGDVVIVPETLGWLLPTMKDYVVPTMPRGWFLSDITDPDLIMLHSYLLEYTFGTGLHSRDEYSYWSYASSVDFNQEHLDNAFERWDVKMFITHNTVNDLDMLSAYMEEKGFVITYINDYIVWANKRLSDGY